MAKTYETQRTNITPRAFWSHVRRELAKKGESIESWVGDEYSYWENPPKAVEYHQTRHGEWDNWDTPTLEANKEMPFDIYLFLEGRYTFIMEFQFDDEKKGTGYCYLFVADEK